MPKGVYKRKENFSLKERLEQNVHFEPNSGCWIWSGSSYRGGYGSLSVKNKDSAAHRISYEEYVGKINPGNTICHKCDTPECINPQHLFQGTQKENIHDMVKKGRSRLGKKKTHCIRGHILPPFDKKRRPCNACFKAHKKRYREELKGASPHSIE